MKHLDLVVPARYGFLAYAPSVVAGSTKLPGGSTSTSNGHPHTGEAATRASARSTFDERYNDKAERFDAIDQECRLDARELRAGLEAVHRLAHTPAEELGGRVFPDTPVCPECNGTGVERLDTGLPERCCVCKGHGR